jgi:predicted nucleic-acid-binding protein
MQFIQKLCEVIDTRLRTSRLAVQVLKDFKLYAAVKAKFINCLLSLNARTILLTTVTVGLFANINLYNLLRSQTLLCSKSNLL